MVTPYLQTLSTIANGDAVPLFRFVNPSKSSQIRSLSTIYDAAPALQSAVESGAKRLTVDHGLFNLESTIEMPSAVSLEGSGDGTVFHQRSITKKASFYFKSSRPNEMVDGFRFKGFVIQCTEGTFFEHQHLIELSGVRNCVVEGVNFYGFRGDGLYIGSGSGNEERHNEDVRVRGCVFDGINNANRNAITVITGDGVTIEDNLFLRCSRNDMPGPIDFEPDRNTWHVIRNLRVVRNRFRMNGGGIGEISIYVPATVALPASGILIAENQSQGYVGRGGFFFHSANRAPSDAQIESAIRLTGNVAATGNRPWQILDGKDVQLSGNKWTDFKQAALLGQRSGTYGVRDVLIEKDQYARSGSVGRVGMSISNARVLRIRDVFMEDCGDGKGTSCAIDFATGSSSDVEIDNLTVAAPTGKTIIAIQKEFTHSFAPETNKLTRSNLNGLSSRFQSR